MQRLGDTSHTATPSVACEASMTLEDVMAAQQAFDVTYFTGAVDADNKRRHITFHVGILAGKLLRIEERVDHDALTDELRSVLVEEVIPDLLVYASQLATLAGVSLDEAYRNRLHDLEVRYASRSVL